MAAEVSIRGYSPDAWTAESLRRLGHAVAAYRVTHLLCGLFVALLCAFLAYKAVTNQITETSIGKEDRDSLVRMIDGTAARPFAYRLLTPALVGLVGDLLPIPALVHGLPNLAQARLGLMCAHFTAAPVPSCDAVAAYMVVAWLWYLTFLLTMAALARQLICRGILPALGVVALSYLTVNAIILLQLSHAYDYGTLMFGALLLLCLAHERHALFCVVLGFACLNKESAIIYGLAFLAVNLPRLRPARIGIYLGVQAVTFLVLHGGVRHRFRTNPGTGMEIFAKQQLYYFTEHIGLARLLPLVFVFIVVFYGFPQKHPCLRRASWVILPWSLLFLVGGQQGELRVTFEVLPVILLLASDSLVRFVGAGPAARHDPIIAGPAV